MRQAAGDPQIILASASPRRKELLRQIGVGFRQQVAAVDESQRAGESARAYVVRLALAKARAVAGGQAAVPVLGADTAVVLGGLPLGKPRDRSEGLAMLRRLAGRSHEVLSAVALVKEREAVRVSETRVWFRDIGERELAAYWDTGEPQDKAGAYAIQGRGAVFIEHIEGSYSGVMGLPLFETAQLLAEFGIENWPQTHRPADEDA